jgi:hypothetical protein
MLRSNTPAPAAYKMHDLQTISLPDRGLTPLIPGDNLQIALDGHAVGWELQPIEQREQRQVSRHLAQFAIQMNTDQLGPL